MVGHSLPYCEARKKARQGTLDGGTPASAGVRWRDEDPRHRGGGPRHYAWPGAIVWRRATHALGEEGVWGRVAARHRSPTRSMPA